MTAPLRGVRDELGAVVSSERVGDMVELCVRLPHIAATARPGQFAQLRCGGTLLRRPFSVAWTESDCACFVFAPVGTGTRALAVLRPGDEVGALGPLGTGFTVDEQQGSAVCVAGGLGCAPFPLLLRALRDAGHEVTVVNGAATARLLYPAERFQRGDEGIAVEAVTVDGSAGAQGLVTDLLGRHLDVAPALYACGPNPMLAAVARMLGSEPRLPRVEASLEAPMGCGFGTCLGCALPVHDGGRVAWALCCREGPVMPVERVAWDELMALPPAHVA